MAELSDILEKFKTPILISKIVQCGLSVLNVVKMSIGFRIGWIRFTRTIGNHRGFFVSIIPRNMPNQREPSSIHLLAIFHNTHSYKT